MPSRSTKVHTSLSFQPVDLECRRLVGATVQLCRRVPKSERYPYTELVHQYVNAAGVNINRACRVYGTEAKIGYLRKANFHIDDLRYQVEVMLTADLITAEAKASWDEKYDEVRRQVTLFLNSLQSRLCSEAESAAGSCGATSNKKDAPSH